MTEQQHIATVVVVCTSLLAVVAFLFYRRFRPEPPSNTDAFAPDDEADEALDEELPERSPGRPPLQPEPLVASAVRPGHNAADLGERQAAITNAFIGCYLWFYLLVFGSLGGIALLVFRVATGLAVPEPVVAVGFLLLTAILLLALVKRRLPFQTPTFAPSERDLVIATTAYVCVSALAYGLHPDPGLLYFVVGVNAFLLYLLAIYFVTRSFLSGRLRTEALLPAVAPALETYWLLSHIF